MIQGTVNDAYEAIISLTVQGPTGLTREVEAVIDTGYNGFLTLPPSIVSELDLAFSSVGRGFLANGEEVRFDVYHGAVQWDGVPRHIRISVADATPLIGMRLLDRHSLYIEIENGGPVIIQPKE